MANTSSVLCVRVIIGSKLVSVCMCVMGNVQLGGPRAFLVRRRLRRLFKKMTTLLLDIEEADVLNPQRIARIRRGLVGSLGMVKLELTIPGATRRSMQVTYNKATTIYDMAFELMRQFHIEVFVARHERIDVL